MSKAETERTKGLRRAILRVLAACQGDRYEGWLTERSLFAVLAASAPGLTMADQSAACQYLASKGKEYIENRARQESKFDVKDADWRILPRGVDLLDETIPPDPGVEDNRQ